MPVLQCASVDPVTGEITWSVCSKADACANPAGYRIDEDSQDTITNFTTQIQPSLICDEHYKRRMSLLGSSMFIGYLTGSVLITPLGDVIGRKKSITIGCLFQAIGLSGITLSLSITSWSTYRSIWGFIFLLGTGTSSHYNLTHVYANELTTMTHQKRI